MYPNEALAALMLIEKEDDNVLELSLSTREEICISHKDIVRIRWGVKVCYSYMLFLVFCFVIFVVKLRY